MGIEKERRCSIRGTKGSSQCKKVDKVTTVLGLPRWRCWGITIFWNYDETTNYWCYEIYALCLTWTINCQYTFRSSWIVWVWKKGSCYDASHRSDHSFYVSSVGRILRQWE